MQEFSLVQTKFLDLANKNWKIKFVILMTSKYQNIKFFRYILYIFIYLVCMQAREQDLMRGGTIKFFRPIIKKI